MHSGACFKNFYPVFLATLLIGGCQHSSPSPPSLPAPAKKTVTLPDPWELTITDPTATEPALLWNGLIGIRLNRFAVATSNGDPALPMFAIDEYEQGGEEKIVPLANPVALQWQVYGVYMSGSVTDYRQSIDMRAGILTTSWKSGSNIYQCETFLVPGERTIAQRWVIESERAVPMKFFSNVGFDSSITNARAVQTEDKGVSTTQIFKTGGRGVRIEQRLSDVLVSNLLNTSTSTNLVGATSPGKKTILERTVTLAAKGGEIPPPPVGYEALRKKTTDTWASRWRTDIEIDGPIEDQQAVRSFLFYLRSAIDPRGGMSISPMGLSSDIYNGHVFWDADVWVFPALALLDPAAAAAVASYRVSKVAATGSFPWESSVSGKEVAPVQFQNERHIGGDVAMESKTAAALGLISPEADATIASAASAALRRISTPRPDGQPEIKNVTSVDEGHRGDNDLYTNLLAQWVLSGRTWAKETPKYYLPRDEQTLLSYDGDRLQGYKQAAAVLSIYPLQYPEAEKSAMKMLDRFGPKVIANGPAMTDSVHALIRARFGDPNAAYDEWKRSWTEFIDHPFLSFSEKRRNDRTYFTTGAAGCLQTVVYGFLGFRIDWKQTPEAVWTKKLHGDSWLSVHPHLPSTWKRVTLKNFSVLGQNYTLTVTKNGAAVKKGES